jgi:hypothetical protein
MAAVEKPMNIINHLPLATPKEFEEDSDATHPATSDISTSSGQSHDSEDAYSLSSRSSSDTPAADQPLEPKTDGYTTYYPHPTTFKLSEHAIDEARSLKVRMSIPSPGSWALTRHFRLLWSALG